MGHETALASTLGTSGEDQVPEKLWGLWQRVSLETPDAPSDTTTRVYWLQTPSLFVDIRIPATRALSADCSCLEDYAAAELAVLAQQDGFAGRTLLDGDLCCWQREIAFQPPSGFPDQGRLQFHDDEIVEEGVHLPYREVWRRVADGDGSWVARRTLAADPQRPGTAPTVATWSRSATGSCSRAPGAVSRWSRRRPCSTSARRAATAGAA